MFVCVFRCSCNLTCFNICIHVCMHVRVFAYHCPSVSVSCCLFSCICFCVACCSYLWQALCLHFIWILRVCLHILSTAAIQQCSNSHTCIVSFYLFFLLCDWAKKWNKKCCWYDPKCDLEIPKQCGINTYKYMLEIAMFASLNYGKTFVKDKIKMRIRGEITEDMLAYFENLHYFTIHLAKMVVSVVVSVKNRFNT